MSKGKSEQSSQERFDKLAGRLCAMQGEQGIELMGAHNIERKIGEKSVRFSVFIPSNQRDSSYSPSILYQTLKIEKAHEGEFLAPESEIYLLRNNLEDEGSKEKLSGLEEALNDL